MSKRSVKPLLLPLLLSLTLIGCATPSPPPQVVKPAEIPAPPAELLEPPDLSQSYSDIVRKLLQTWQQKLTDWKRGS